MMFCGPVICRRIPGDQDILAQSHRDQRVLITLDKDFGELAIRRGLPHCGIMRLVNVSARQQGAVCPAHLDAIWG